VSRSILSILALAIAVALTVALACVVISRRAQRGIAFSARPLVASTQQDPAPATDSYASIIPDDGPDDGKTLRAAVIGGMVETGFFQDLADRYEKETGVRVKILAAGPKMHLEEAFKHKVRVDLITMHASDTIVNLVADGYCRDPQPWLRNDQVIVGPPEDPAGIRGMTDAAAALAKIAAVHCPFVVHSSLGTQEVLRSILELNNIHLDESRLTINFLDNQRNVLHIAAQQHAYTLVGRIPFRMGKLPSEGLQVMVQGDPRLRRPYLVAVSDPAKVPGARYELARQFARYLRLPETQAWIAQYGKGKLDADPMFFPVVVPPTTTKMSVGD
jgi:tungstate transport system substrate-binding protein